MALRIGSKAPDFQTTDQDGKSISLSGLKGKKFVLYFYPKDMTPGCTAEACNLRDNYSALQKAGYEIFGISSDNEKSHQKFIAKEKLPFRLLADTDKSVHAKFGTWVEKSMYGRKYMGTARVTFVVDGNGVIENIIEKVDTRDHAAQILGKPATAAAPAKKAAKAKPAVKKKPAKKVAPKKASKKKK
jgi:peroxiredoxin Q/BCP